MNMLIILCLILSATQSLTIHEGQGGHITLLKDTQNAIKVDIPKASVDNYLVETEQLQVTITTDVEISDSAITFTLGPTGLYFTEPMQLTIKGTLSQKEMWLFDEGGEAIEGTMKKNGNSVTFDISHFSNYYYDLYDYY